MVGKAAMYKFYYRDVAPKSVINARSVALPWSCKRTILT